MLIHHCICGLYSGCPANPVYEVRISGVVLTGAPVVCPPARTLIPCASPIATIIKLSVRANTKCLLLCGPWCRAGVGIVLRSSIGIAFCRALLRDSCALCACRCLLLLDLFGIKSARSGHFTPHAGQTLSRCCPVRVPHRARTLQLSTLLVLCVLTTSVLWLSCGASFVCKASCLFLG